MSDKYQMQEEITAIISTLRSLESNAKKSGKLALKEASGILVSAIKARAPQSLQKHSRYSQGIRRAGPGYGKKVATYSPGNLKRSIKTLDFKRSNAVFVGPNLAKGAAKGNFSGNRTDAYYAGMVNSGTEKMAGKYFVESAEVAAGAQTLRFATELLRREVDKFIQKKGLV